MPGTGTVTPWRDSAEAAEHARTTVGTLRQLRHQGKGPKFYRVGRKVMYKIEDLDTWITGGGQ